jgi:DNA-binding NarL/FixJ family response regulator
MTDEEATAYALAVEETAPAPASSPEPPQTVEKTPAALTLREWEVADMVARGLTNRRIAEELHISERTVTTHVRRILKKLGVRSREQVADSLAHEKRPRHAD